jgi:hypothetical protein
MFEAPEQQVPDSKVGIWIGVVVVAIIAAGLFWYVSRKPGANASSSAVSTASMGTAASTSAPGADPAKDLRVVSVTMQKDPSGTTAQWLVDIKNDSHVYTYSNIGYETTYLGANQNVLTVNHGTMNLTIPPGEDQSTQFNDVLYPDGTSIYRLKVTGANSSQ